ncbi:hypothetical protein [Saccharibacillus endophyticus]|uniref:Secreted protein n=1 Tax=Saccharibacillus endophyticus TaxID=2060666 RepID=A0ABQ2A499_9BACL|nr:hypothetical protein [Saccharibacillus endophyticus]GGH85813.1 hypothetical protein GCM10007362_44120 [Saccharibacillus endophyticus]
MKKIQKAIAASVFAAVAAVAVVAPASASSITGINGTSSIDIRSMDLESAMMAVQQQRANLLEQQLKDQMQSVQDRNAQLAILNSQLNEAQANGDTATAEARKAQIDALSSTQQMDMLRLQSLSNKRNEAFDVMTNFIKKMQDSRSSIIANMR